MALFFKKPKYDKAKPKPKKVDIPDGLWTKCDGCGDIIFNKTLDDNMMVCPKCNFHFILGMHERIKITLDTGSFQEIDEDLASVDPLEFQGPKT